MILLACFYSIAIIIGIYIMILFNIHFNIFVTGIQGYMDTKMYLYSNLFNHLIIQIKEILTKNTNNPIIPPAPRKRRRRTFFEMISCSADSKYL